MIRCQISVRSPSDARVFTRTRKAAPPTSHMLCAMWADILLRRNRVPQPPRHPPGPEPHPGHSTRLLVHGPVPSGRPCNAPAARSIATSNNTDALALGATGTGIVTASPTGPTTDRSHSCARGVRPSHGRHTLRGRRRGTHRRSTTATASERNLTDPSTVSRPIPAHPKAAHDLSPDIFQAGFRSSSPPCVASVASLCAGFPLTPAEGPPAAPSTSTGQPECMDATAPAVPARPKVSPRSASDSPRFSPQPRSSGDRRSSPTDCTASPSIRPALPPPHVTVDEDVRVLCGTSGRPSQSESPLAWANTI
ncbi:hypothetical protein Franean1_0028 [Parafrankia sp. EAN1pec]|nr:hypothetical protein Franean1_0028 [Frankia sp. EAN1pec]